MDHDSSGDLLSRKLGIQAQDPIVEFYADYDSDDKYERLYGYVNPVSAAYWRIRDELVMESVTSRFDTLEKPIEVLEVGAGHGHELAKFAHLGIPQSHLTGIDLVPHRVDRARKTYPSINFYQQDAAHLDFANDTFDVVCQFLCVVQAASKSAQKATCDELVRVLKPGGIIIWFDVAPLRWRIVLLRRLFDLVMTRHRRSTRRLLQDIWTHGRRSLQEAVSSSLRRQAVTNGSATYLRPMTPKEVVELFPGSKVRVAYAGIEYTCWELLWRRSRALAEALWRAGWFSDHCFAVIEKAAA